MNRRDTSKALGVAAFASALKPGAGAQDEPDRRRRKESSRGRGEPLDEQHERIMAAPGFQIAMLVYPGFYLQDLVGPLAVFEMMMNTRVHLVWKNLEPVGNTRADRPALVPVTPTAAFKDCPDDLDVLFVPGGPPGTLQAMQDEAVLDFLARKGKSAKYVTSVCTGSVVLGAAGLLEGYRATSHWSTRDLLPLFGATPVAERVVVDRNRITGGGVTAGLDFGLTIAGRLRGDKFAKAIQLMLEYDPRPPYDAGNAILTARSAPPVNLVGRTLNNPITINLRPDVVSGRPLHVTDDGAPGGRRFNPAAFAQPPANANDTFLRQGTLGRNALRGFSLYQTDLALRRQFNLTERVRLQLRAEASNVFNRPNFAAPIEDISNALFGRSTQLFGRGLSAGGGPTGGFNPLYQTGGPRSIQLAAKILF